MIDNLIAFLSGFNLVLSLFLTLLVLLWACIRMWFSVYYKVKYFRRPSNNPQATVRKDKPRHPYIQRGDELDEGK